MKRRHVSVAASDIDATCCDAISNKAWVHGPEGIAWEVFQTSRESTGLWQGRKANARFGRSAAKPSPCCTPRSEAAEGIKNG
jgi:hypothetical protein